MTTPTKRKIKRFIIHTEMWWYGITGILWLAVLALVCITAPKVGGLTIVIVQLVSGFTATVAAAASAIKASDTEE